MRQEILKKPKLILQVDCDSEYVVRKHYGLSDYHDKDSFHYYTALDIFLKRFRDYRVKSTLFVVGKDLKNKIPQQKIGNAVSGGHELANHSYGHPNEFSGMPDKRFLLEVQKTNNLIHTLFGITCKGFRAPNFDISTKQIKLLAQEGFEYDCSVLPTPYLPILKLLKMSDAGKSGYLGRTYMAPQNPYIPDEKKIWKKGNSLSDNSILEIPVTTFPYLRFPCHFSYLLAMPPGVAIRVMEALIKWHIKKNEPLIFIFHLTDLIDNDYLYGTELKYYKSFTERLYLFDVFLKTVNELFTSVTTTEYRNYILKAGAV